MILIFTGCSRKIVEQVGRMNRDIPICSVISFHYRSGVCNIIVHCSMMINWDYVVVERKTLVIAVWLRNRSDWSQRKVHHLIWWRQLESYLLVDAFDRMTREFAALKFEALKFEALAERCWMQLWCHHRQIVHRGIKCEHHYQQYVFFCCWLEEIVSK